MKLADLLMPLSVLARLTGRPYWQAHYSHRDPIGEPECEWVDLPRDGMRQLRLICPNGQVAVLGDDVPGGIGDRAFQFKQAVASIGVGPDAGRVGGRRTTAHVIGVVYSTKMDCRCFAWETGTKELVGPFIDNFEFFAYGNAGHLSAPVLLGKG